MAPSLQSVSDRSSQINLITTASIILKINVTSLTYTPNENMAEGLSKEDIVKAMTAADTLNGWDVLVAYDEKKVNQILAFRASQVPDVLTGLGEFEASGYGE
jgi:hypothetical protein